MASAGRQALPLITTPIRMTARLNPIRRDLRVEGSIRLSLSITQVNCSIRGRQPNLFPRNGSSVFRCETREIRSDRQSGKCAQLVGQLAVFPEKTRFLPAPGPNFLAPKNGRTESGRGDSALGEAVNRRGMARLKQLLQQPHSAPPFAKEAIAQALSSLFARCVLDFAPWNEKWPLKNLDVILDHGFTARRIGYSTSVSRPVLSMTRSANFLTNSSSWACTKALNSGVSSRFFTRALN
jgi:hypothetical protein